jgi:hypothetical protein
VRTTVSAVNPWRTALRRDWPSPASVVEPVLLRALRRLASICLKDGTEDDENAVRPLDHHLPGKTLLRHHGIAILSNARWICRRPRTVPPGPFFLSSFVLSKNTISVSAYVHFN